MENPIKMDDSGVPLFNMVHLKMGAPGSLEIPNLETHHF